MVNRHADRNDRGPQAIVATLLLVQLRRSRELWGCEELQGTVVIDRAGMQVAPSRATRCCEATA